MELAPSLLVSVPQLRDPNFDHAVVLLLEHDAEGSFGLVINRETEHPLAEFCAQQKLEYRGAREARVFVGGPVGTTQGFVLCSGPVDDVVDDVLRQVGAGIWFSADAEVLARLSRQTATAYRLLIGYAGWGPGQLDAEIAAGAWIAGPADAALIFDTPPQDVWSRTLEGLGIDPRTIVVRGDRALN